MARKIFRCLKCGSWSELGPPGCRHRGEHAEVVHVASAGPGTGGGPPTHRIVTASGRGSSAGREKKFLLLQTEEPSSRGRWITERMDAYEHAQKRGAVKGALRDAYNSRARLGPITVRYTSAGVVYD